MKDGNSVDLSLRYGLGYARSYSTRKTLILLEQLDHKDRTYIPKTQVRKEPSSDQTP